MENNRKGLEQGRAAFAYECAEEGKKALKPTQIVRFNNHYFKDDKYKQYVKKVPMMIKTNGLGNSFAFVLSKTQASKKINNQDVASGQQQNPKNGYDLIYEQVTAWVKQNLSVDELAKFDKENDLVRYIITLESSEYRALTVEVLALFGWLKRFAEGLIEGEDDNSNS